jgi:hypothetical protein
MPYESLEREMERRKLRRTKGDKKIERNSFPYRRGGRKGSKNRTKQSESVENWSGDEEGQLSKALAAARERANIVKPQLNIKKLPPRNTQFGAEESFQAEPWTGNCQRCGDRTSHNYKIMSWFNTDIICMDCADKETKHPKFQEAKDRENEEVRKGNLNYEGIGFDAENIRLRPIELKILQYLSQFSPDGVTRWDPPAGLTKSEIAEAVGQKSRTGVINPLNRLIEMKLVVSMQKRPPGARRVVDVFFPTYEGLKVAKKIPTQRMAETNSMDIDGDGQVENWEVQAHENNLTGLGHEETFNAPSNKDKQIEIRELAIEVLTEAKTWLWLQDLTNRIKTKTKGGHKKITTQFVSKVIGKSRGGANGFYVTRDGKIYYHGDTDRGEFIRGMF